MTNWFTQNGKVLTNNGKIRGCCCGIRRTALLISNYNMYHQIIWNNYQEIIGYCMRTRSVEHRLYGTFFDAYDSNTTVICSSGTVIGALYQTPSPDTFKKYIITASTALKVEEYKNGVVSEVFNMTLAEIEAEKSGTVLFSGTIYGTWDNANPCNSGEATCTITKLDRYE